MPYLSKTGLQKENELLGLSADASLLEFFKVFW